MAALSSRGPGSWLPVAFACAALLAVGAGLTGGCADLAGVQSWRQPICGPVDKTNPSCADCVKNGLETDTDCGGDSCAPCSLGLHCKNDADCASANCSHGTCASARPVSCPAVDATNPTCADCQQNGSETDVDCGGDVCGPCPVGKQCQSNADCASGNCANGVCGEKTGAICPPQPDPLNPTCSDCAKNADETDVDCGGDRCAPCKEGQACVVDADCATANCGSDGRCAQHIKPTCPSVVDPSNPTCADCTKNGLETDIDCGGDACPPCTFGKSCRNNTDCVSGVCYALTCF